MTAGGVGIPEPDQHPMAVSVVSSTVSICVIPHTFSGYENRANKLRDLFGLRHAESCEWTWGWTGEAGRVDTILGGVAGD